MLGIFVIFEPVFGAMSTKVHKLTAWIQGAQIWVANYYVFLIQAQVTGFWPALVGWDLFQGFPGYCILVVLSSQVPHMVTEFCGCVTVGVFKITIVVIKPGFEICWCDSYICFSTTSILISDSSLVNRTSIYIFGLSHIWPKFKKSYLGQK